MHVLNPGSLPKPEVAVYVRRAEAMVASGELPPDTDAILLEPDGDTIGISYLRRRPKFQRIRRITGYLTGTLDTWNDAKKAEEKDRVKHLEKEHTK